MIIASQSRKIISKGTLNRATISLRLTSRSSHTCMSTTMQVFQICSRQQAMSSCCSLPAAGLLAALALLLAHDLVKVAHTLLLVGLGRPLGAHLGRKLAHLLLVISRDHDCRLLLHLQQAPAISALSNFPLAWQEQRPHPAEREVIQLAPLPNESLCKFHYFLIGNSKRADWHRQFCRRLSVHSQLARALQQAWPDIQEYFGTALLLTCPHLWVYWSHITERQTKTKRNDSKLSGSPQR